ncbi:AraC family transcriptional regulator [Chryseolinea lacunae]|uniref:Helix-turn-helix domain-containing protein n=1 Tax=Chryseolinea lacunae TaxID=2801331 RepID=A0ABS1KML1_9BACT|nr:helix-turn-helix transcriptional regulator [Chryseolinea lacunae]MBL0740694.1 helix-turn-helix domain-containing protein [Chryseolinea lacunae]
MRKKSKSIPLNTMAQRFGAGIAVGKATIKDLHTFEEAEQSHRDDYHLFFLQEKGSTPIEIDFQKYKIKPSSVIYIHPNQIHRVGEFQNITLSFLAINNESLAPEYHKLLGDIAPVKPLLLKKETFALISEAVSLCIKLSERKHEKLYHSLLKDSCNTLVALIASQYLSQSRAVESLSRFEIIAKSFKASLEQNFVTIKKPAAYASMLNISIPYLNECVRNTTGQSVSHHIQQRVVLEAKRLLYHSTKTVKEIADELGYDDYPYFSRLFAKVTKMSPLTFRSKNLD